MENAGRAVAEFIHTTLKTEQKNILVLCGTGNNGGDGFVAARYLSQHYPTTLLLLSSPNDIKTDIATANYHLLTKTNVQTYTKKDIKHLPELLSSHEIIVDAMLGIGLTGKLREPYTTTVNLINNTPHNTIIAVDVPTGLDSTPTIQPTYTLTLHDLKQGMNKNNSGSIKIIDIGIPPQASTHVGPGELMVYYPRPTVDSHKRDNGVVLIIGGGPYYGAPALAGLAAYRTGTDLVHIATPKWSAQPIACYSPNYIVHSLSEEILTIEDLSLIQSLIEQATSIIIGPGLGTAIETKDAIQEIINNSSNLNKPIVIDADAIQPFAEIITLIQNPHIVVTPHAGEYQKLTRHHLPQNLPDRIKHITKWAQKHTMTVLFKGPTDIISDGTTIKLNTTHNPAMTVGGTGDVLAGIIGALLSKKVTPFPSGCVAAFINGAAGNQAFSEKSYGILATDIIEHIPTVLQKYL